MNWARRAAAAKIRPATVVTAASSHHQATAEPEIMTSSADDVIDCQRRSRSEKQRCINVNSPTWPDPRRISYRLQPNE